MNNEKTVLMFDTNIYDKLNSDPHFRQKLISLQKMGRIEILRTHIQEDELSKVPFNSDEVPNDTISTDAFILGVSKLGEARLGDGSEILEEETIPTDAAIVGISRIGQSRVGDGSGKIEEKKIPTDAAIWGVSQWDASSWGNGSQSGMSVNDIITPAGNRIEDSLIAVTASNRADVFVTEDIKLARKMKKHPAKCQVMDYMEFKKFAEEF